MGKEQKKNFAEQKRLTGEETFTVIEVVVEAHCRLTRKFRGAAHQSCRLIVKKGQFSFAPVLFHNICTYDSQLFMKILVDNCPKLIF